MPYEYPVECASAITPHLIWAENSATDGDEMCCKNCPMGKVQAELYCIMNSARAFPLLKVSKFCAEGDSGAWKMYLSILDQH